MKCDARLVAARHLLEVDCGAASDALSRRDDFLALPEADRRFTMQLVFGVLRARGTLDCLLEALSTRPTSRLDREVLWIGRLGIYQLRTLRVPPHAVVHETVDLCKRLRKSSAAGWVNAVLRNYLRNPPRLPGGDSIEALATRYSHPGWLVARYVERYGRVQARQLLERNNREPKPSLWVNPFKSSLEALCQELKKEEIAHEVCPETPGCLTAPKSLVLHRLYREGHCFFMDSASQAVAQSLRVEGADKVGDFCAAPGGKSFVLASRLEQGALLIASDRSQERLSEMRERSGLYAIPSLELLQADIERSAPFRRVFQAILTDVPCSGLGTLGSNPEIRWRIQESDLVDFSRRQLAILRNSFSCLMAGGELLYSTCSTEPEENEEVIQQFLAEESAAELVQDPVRNFPQGASGDCFFRARVRHRTA